MRSASGRATALCTHHPCPSRARSLEYNNLDDDAKRAITAVTRPGLDVQL